MRPLKPGMAHCVSSFFSEPYILRRQFSLGRLGRKLGSVLGIALVALVVHWFQGTSDSTSPDVPATADRAGSTQTSTGGTGRANANSPVPTASRSVASPNDSPVPPGRTVLTGTVTKVADGDTVTLRVNGKSQRVRLDSIDAPETNHGAQEPGQPFAEAAQRHLEKMVGGKTVTAQCYEPDQFSRELCALILPDGTSVNRAQVAAGYAWAYTASRGDYLTDKAMRGIQDQARRARVGLWVQDGAVEPWKWRYECWRNQRCGSK
ncbi:TNase-like domain-containing protein [Bordetella tumulicola]